MDMRDELKKYRGGQMGYTVDPVSGKAYMVQRDLGNCLKIIVREALDCTRAVLKNPEELEIADKVESFLAGIYVNTMKDQSGLGLFKQLYDYLSEEDRENKGCDVYGLFCSFFVQSLFCYLFSVKALALGLPPDIDDDGLREFNTVVTLLAVLDDNTKAEVMKQFLAAGFWPTNVDYSKLLRRLDDYLELVEESKNVTKKLDDRQGNRAQRRAMRGGGH